MDDGPGFALVDCPQYARAPPAVQQRSGQWSNSQAERRRSHPQSNAVPAPYLPISPSSTPSE